MKKDRVSIDVSNLLPTDVEIVNHHRQIRKHVPDSELRRKALTRMDRIKKKRKYKDRRGIMPHPDDNEN